jgi:hypothetical protein
MQSSQEYSNSSSRFCVMTQTSKQTALLSTLCMSSINPMVQPQGQHLQLKLLSGLPICSKNPCSSSSSSSSAASSRVPLKRQPQAGLPAHSARHFTPAPRQGQQQQQQCLDPLQCLVVPVIYRV